MSRRCGSLNPTPTPLNGKITKPTRDAKKKEKKEGLDVRLFPMRFDLKASDLDQIAFSDVM